MKNLIAIALIFISSFTTSCVQSIHALYTEQDLISDDSMIGTWEDKQSGETWTFIKAGRLEYKLIQVDEDGKAGEFTARLVKVENRVFLDLLPMRPAGDNTDLFQSQLIRTHTFAYIARRSDSLEVSVLEMNWLKDTVARDPAAVRHEKIGGDIVMTAQPKEMQKFLIDSLAVKGAFSEPAVLMQKRRGS